MVVLLKKLGELLIDKLPDSLTYKQKKRRIKYLVNQKLARDEMLIENIGKNSQPIWALKK